ncbi:type IV toxin-antitoxin system AbiEi family antitoxin domain-containing protein [Dyadobacter endophyticus]|uniref:type IV toxin-antitoxin system AbiEi family antitoxin domain-containing protein n=1 Tax=Dyadobacter endophyticus TaxID=1749036 RepID=UPI003CEF3A60
MASNDILNMGIMSNPAVLQSIRELSNQPLTRQLLTSILRDHKEPVHKIEELLLAGHLETVRDGMYLPTKKLSPFRPEPFLLANHLFGPSYVSFESALSFYGLIPERVYEVTSATTKRTERLNTSIAAFSFTWLPLPYYSFGIRHLELGNEQHILIASPEKALFDKIVTTVGVKLNSSKSATEYLIENLRIDEDDLQELDTKVMETWLGDAPKSKTLSMIIKSIKGLK